MYSYVGSYQLDNKIKDVYEQTPKIQQIKKIGLSPYAMIGSLSIAPSRNKYVPSHKPSLNMHHFSYVGPLVGASLSPLKAN